MEVIIAIIGAVAAVATIGGVLVRLARWLRPSKDAQEEIPPSPPPPRESDTGVSHWLGRPASLGDGFVGRETELKDLTEAFEGHQATIVSGGAGTGKSRLAAEYAHQCGLNGFWTDAGDSVAQTLAALAPALDVEVEGRNDEEIAAQVQKELAELAPDTLWVVDNLGDLNLVNELLSAVGPIRLLITTRHSASQLLPPQVAFVPLETLAPEPAVALLCSRSDSDRKDRALPELAEAVGRLPLALEQLAVRLGEPLQTPDKLLAALREAPTAIKLQAFEAAAGAAIPRAEGVYATIAGTLASLPADIRDQIAPLGYLADAPVPEPLLAALTGLNEEGLSRLLAQCSQQSVLIVREGQVVVHALTTAAIAATNDDAALRTAVERAWQRLCDINTDAPIALRAELIHHESIYVWAMQRIGAQEVPVLHLATCLAIAYSTAGRIADSIHLEEETLAAYERVLGAEHRDTLMSRNNLANRYRAVGRKEEALRLYEETLAVIERIFGPDHLETLQSRNNLANGYSAVGRKEEALRLHEETLMAAERVLGPDHPETLTSRNNLAAAYWDVGRREESNRLDEEALAARERVLGPDHPNTLLSRHNLAVGYGAVGRIDEAIRLDEETLAARERVLGPDHQDTLRTRTNLAGGYRAAGRDEDADRLEGKAAPEEGRAGKSKPKRKRRGSRKG